MRTYKTGYIGRECRISMAGDMGIRGDAKAFFGVTCVIVKRTQSGLIQVVLKDNPRVTYSFPQRNIELLYEN